MGRNTAKQTRFRKVIAQAKPACHICGQAIDWNAGHLDPRSFVIDHVIPLAKGGEDALPNLRAAHRHPLLQ
ncbi:HNH endonuclease signature motif containing protein [Plantibacter sp. H53]|uniref:HNH endonuclease n=1 Tax=Plantibacter sp. H53 TaxID=1827323 RepID=UPI000A52BA85